MDEPKYLTDAIIPSLKSEMENSLPKLYNSYSTAKDGANTAEFINGLLNANFINLGLNATMAGAPFGIAIGANSKVSPGNGGGIAIGYGSTADTTDNATYGSIAIGYNSHANGNKSVAIGNSAVTTRNYELSCGKSGQEHYIANVKAGELDTDAVNVKQMKDTIAVQVGSIDTLLQTINTGVGV